ncbi:MAG: WD40 repeat domain-containing protein [Xenococcaceae cyanobacterium]
MRCEKGIEINGKPVMEQWFNLLLQVAKPVFTTLVYTGASSILSEIQDELKNEQKHQTKLVLNSLGIEEKKVRGIQDFIQDVTSIELADSEDRQPSFQEEKALQQQLVADKRKTLLEIAAKARETTLQLPEVNKTLEHWPLRLFPSQLLESRRHDGPIPLRIFIAPPKVPFEGFDEIGLGTQEIEQRLAQGLREFLSQHYSLHCKVRPTEFLGGAWDSKHFHGESSIKTLFWMLKGEPTLILESEIEGDYLNLRMAYWGLGQEKYCYETIFKLCYREFIEESAKARALKWKETRDKLLALGKKPEEINRLGGDNAINLAILEEAEELQAAGIDIRELTFDYQVNRKDFEALCQFFSICHCLVAGWVADIHYLVHYDLSLRLPELLPQLVKDVPEQKSLQAVIRTTVLIYQDVLKALARERPYWGPELALKLAQSLNNLPDKSLAKEQVDYSLQLWLQQHQLSKLEEVQAMESTITLEDQEYLETLKACLSVLGDEQGVAQVQDLLRAIAQLKHQRHFSLGHTFTGVSGKVSSLAISSDGQSLFSGGDRSTIELWRLDRRSSKTSPGQMLTGHSGEVLTFTLSSDGHTLASSDKTEQRSYIKIWNLQTGKLHRTLFGHKKPIRSLAISSWKEGSNQQFIASGSHKIKLWDIQTGEPFQTLFGHKQWVYSLAISVDGQTLISGSEDKTVRIWNLRTGDLVGTLTGHQRCVRSVTISFDGRTLVSGSDDKTIKLWDLGTGKLLHTFTGHSGAVQAVAISPNRQHLISGSEDKTIKIWNLNTGELLQTLTGHSEAVGAIAISPDGQILASGSGDKTIKIWRTF